MADFLSRPNVLPLHYEGRASREEGVKPLLPYINGPNFSASASLPGFPGISASIGQNWNREGLISGTFGDYSGGINLSTGKTWTYDGSKYKGDKSSKSPTEESKTPAPKRDPEDGGAGSDAPGTDDTSEPPANKIEKAQDPSRTPGGPETPTSPPKKEEDKPTE